MQIFFNIDDQACLAMALPSVWIRSPWDRIAVPHSKGPPLRFAYSAQNPGMGHIAIVAMFLIGSNEISMTAKQVILHYTYKFKDYDKIIVAHP